jgi:hypothetical protein
VACKEGRTKPPKEFGKGVDSISKTQKVISTGEIARLNRIVHTTSRTINCTSGTIPFRIPHTGTTSTNLSVTIPRMGITLTPPTRASTPEPVPAQTSPITAENMDLSAMAKDLFGTDSEDEPEKDFNHKR